MLTSIPKNFTGRLVMWSGAEVTQVGWTWIFCATAFFDMMWSSDKNVINISHDQSQQISFFFFIMVIRKRDDLPEIRLRIHGHQLSLLLGSFFSFIDHDDELLKGLISMFSPEPRRSSQAIDSLLRDKICVPFQEATFSEKGRRQNQNQLFILLLVHLCVQKRCFDVQRTCFPLKLGAHPNEDSEGC